MDKCYYLVDNSGKLRFTQEGLQKLGSYFALAGIDIKNIKTLKAYKQAREQASPYFLEHLSERASHWPRTDQFDLLKTAVFGSEEDLERDTKRFDLKQSFKLVK